MSTVGSSTDSAAILAALNKKEATTSDTSSAANKNTLGQDAFMKLLVTQLKNQNPLDPQDNTAFVAQLAQFSSLEGIQSLNSTVTGLAGGLQSSQALQASALVGRIVSVESSKANFTEGGGVFGSIELPKSTSNLQLNIYDSKDKLVFSKALDAQNAGELPFGWDGTATDGTKLASGTYRFEAKATDDGKSETLTTYLGANVNSVTIGANQAVILNVDGVGQVAWSDVKEIL
ncbi:MAG: flagellar hook assembly protein FlgD [Spongiibacteraceae bacterium]